MYPWLLRADHKVEFRKEWTAKKWDPNFSYGDGSHINTRDSARNTATSSTNILSNLSPTNSVRTVKGFGTEQPRKYC